MRASIVQDIHDSIQTKQRLLEETALLDAIEATAQACLECYRRGGKILLAGNGGSAADAQHIAAELVGRYGFERPSLSAIALTTDTSALTAIGNDYGYEKIFSRQLEGLGNAGDLFIGISTSGNSANVLEAFEVARTKAVPTIALVGRDGGAMAPLADIAIVVPSEQTPRIQETHILIGHILCSMIERELFAHDI
ncbi:MAG: D-sedoheptulose 7-phosphate isomerase [Sulfurimonas sp.]|nr:MAG: D-sedoheptulose 7-phosphate isomerase [Sulfurimonas sp.]